jgi:hypothetical protein
MSRVTYFVAMPILADEHGDLFVGHPVECHSADDAIHRAARMAASAFGSIAFSRTGDLALGDYEPAVILARHGAIPADIVPLMGEVA